jgi:ABC-type transport system substrate-binding protein
MRQGQRWVVWGVGILVGLGTFGVEGGSAGEGGYADDTVPPTVFQAAGPTIEAIQGTVDQLREVPVAEEADGADQARPTGAENAPHDPQEAVQLLAEAGYPNGFDAGELVPIPPFHEVGEAVVNYLNAKGRAAWRA